MSRRFRHERYFPHYNNKLDYGTNANSFYHYLGKHQELMQQITDEILQLFEDTELTIQEFQDRLDGIKEEMKDFFILWLEDGTLEQIINENIFEDLNTQINQLNIEVSNARKNTLNQTFASLKERLDEDYTQLNRNLSSLEEATTTGFTAINNSISDIETKLNTKRKQLSNILYVSDYEKLAGETDDELINRVFSLLPRGEGTVILDGIIYNIQNPITIGRYQSLKGAGHATVLECNVNARNIIQVEIHATHEYTYGISIEDLQVVGNYNNWGIDLKKSTHVLIKNVYVYNVEWGIYGSNVWLAHYDRVTVRNYDVKMGEYGFNIGGGTSNVYTNTWVRGFKKGYLSASIYTTFNSSACDSFTEYAYHLSQNTTLNGCGAETGNLIEGGYVFGAGARPVTFNNCEVMNIEYQGTQDKAHMFYFNGTSGVINGFRIHGNYQADKMAFMILKGASAIKTNGHSFRNDFTTMYDFKSTQATVVEDSRTTLISYRHNGATTHLEY